MRLGVALTAVGSVVALGYFFWYIPSIGWGPPGSAAYDDYSRANRMFAVVLVVILAGAALTMFARPSVVTRVVFAGALLMLIGNVAEFWVFDTVAYTEATRIAAWLTFLIGAALFFLTLGLAGSLWSIKWAGLANTARDAASK